jgi:hypothetical protein
LAEQIGEGADIFTVYIATRSVFIGVTIMNITGKDLEGSYRDETEVISRHLPGEAE